jgi:hypothetical protein
MMIILFTTSSPSREQFWRCIVPDILSDVGHFCASQQCGSFWLKANNSKILYRLLDHGATNPLNVISGGVFPFSWF